MVVRTEAPQVPDLGRAVVFDRNDVVDLEELVGWILTPLGDS
jgi:hypothetical protein